MLRRVIYNENIGVAVFFTDYFETSAEIPVTRISSHSENVCLSAEISQSNSPVARKDRKPKLLRRILTINLSLQPIYYEIHRRFAICG